MHFLLSLLFATAVVPTAQAGVSMDTHARAPDVYATSPGAAGLELAVTPAASLSLTSAEGILRLDYSLRAGWLSNALEPAPTLLQTGRLSYIDRLGPRLDFLASGWGRYGQETWLFALSPEGALPDLLPAVGRITIGAFTGLAALRYRWSPTWTLQLSAGYDASGGMDTLARSVLPFGYGPRGELGVFQDLTARDQLRGRLTFQHTEFTSGPAYDISGLTFDWERRFAGGTRLTPSAGILVSRDARIPVTRAAFQVHPALSLAVAHRFVWTGSQLALEGRVYAGPALDRLTGLLDDQAGIHAAATWQATRRLSAGALVDQLWVLGPGFAIGGALRSIGAQAAYVVADGIEIHGGLQLYSQSVPSTAGPYLAGSGWDLFVGLRAFVGTAPTGTVVNPRTGRETRSPILQPGEAAGTGEAHR